MVHLITNPQKFADLFNAKVLGVHRQITVDDIRLLTECGLIKRYGWYDSTDIQTIIGILKFELITQQSVRKGAQEASPKQPRCKLCGQALPTEPESKKGRPREYCSDCESARSTIRSRKWRRKMRAAMN